MRMRTPLTGPESSMFVRLRCRLKRSELALAYRESKLELLGELRQMLRPWRSSIGRPQTIQCFGTPPWSYRQTCLLTFFARSRQFTRPSRFVNFFEMGEDCP